MIVLPQSIASGFPGNRVDAKRAGIIAMNFIFGCAVFCGRQGRHPNVWLYPNSMQKYKKNVIVFACFAFFSYFCGNFEYY